MKFKNTYRIKSSRAPFWDYSQNGIYFITICTKNKKCFFGDISAGEMVLSPLGFLVQEYWIQIPKHFSYVDLGEFIIMPNHIHGVLIFDKDFPLDFEKASNLDISIPEFPEKVRSPKANPKWKSASLGVVINQYKRICTISAKKLRPDFAWQARYYDHIIRSYESFEIISRYIVDNPIKWEEDKLFMS